MLHLFSSYKVCFANQQVYKITSYRLFFFNKTQIVQWTFPYHLKEIICLDHSNMFKKFNCGYFFD